MTGLTYDNFERTSRASKKESVETINAKEILERHNNNVGSFYNVPMETENTNGESSNTIYDDMIEQLSDLMSPNTNHHRGENTDEDISDLRGDTLSQVYYYSLTAILLYLLYRLLYTRRK